MSMSLVETLPFVLIGTAAAVAALVALLLPERRALQSALTLVLGAGVGVAALAIGLFASGDAAPDNTENVFLAASVCGFVGVLAGLWLVWQRSHSAETAD
jgi:peptidoglycan/LPS O-acetylase OafA/YrhL